MHHSLQAKRDQTAEGTRRGKLLHLSAAAAMFKSELCFYFKIHQRLPRSIRDIAVSPSNTQGCGINKGNVIFFAISVFHFPLFRLDIINCVLGSTSYLVQTPVLWCPIVRIVCHRARVSLNLIPNKSSFSLRVPYQMEPQRKMPSHLFIMEKFLLCRFRIQSQKGG